MKTLMICVSVHNGCTLKVAKAMRTALGAKLIKPSELHTVNLKDFDMIGLGSGIYDNTFHPSILNLVDTAQTLKGKKVFVFSTAGVLWQDAHIDIRAKLLVKNAEIVGEFRCKGFNTNSFLKHIGGINRGKPNADDLKRAQSFAQNLLR